MKTLCVFTIIVLGGAGCYAAQAPKTVPLDDVVAEVESSLRDYQKDVTSSDNVLPPLKTAELNFKTVVQKQGTSGSSILIFTLKGSKQHQQTNDLQILYGVPKPTGSASYNPVPLHKELLDAIRTASRAIESSMPSSSLGGLNLTTTSISIKYAVTTSFSAEGKPVIQFVILNLAESYNKNEVQSIELIFERK